MEKKGSSPMNRTSKLVSYLMDLQFEKLPKDVPDIAKLLMLDLIGVGFYSSSTPWSEIVAKFSERQCGEGESTVFANSFKTNPQYAAMANATMGHGFELDDVHDPSVSHPGAVVIPTALALGERERINGKRLITAIVAGYEVMGRVGMAAGKTLIERGFHPTSTYGSFGAIASAGKILNLNKKQYLNGFGIVGSMASGIMEFSQDEEGNMIKRFHAGIAAGNGVTAAILAKMGLTGPCRVLEGTFGFCNAFSDAPEMGKIDRHLGKDFVIRHISVKPYACCRLFHSAIDALNVLREEMRIDPKKIKKVSIGGPKILVTQHMVYSPKSIMAAQYSLPFMVAMGILKDVEDPNAFDEKVLVDKDVLNLAKRIYAFEDLEMEKVFPEKFASRVILELRDGSTKEKVVHDSRGTPARRMTEEEMVRKFRKISKDIFDEKRLDAIIEKIMMIEEARDISELTEMLGK